MGIEDIRRELRGSDAETALLVAHEAGGAVPHAAIFSALGGDALAAASAANTLRELGLSDGGSLAGDTTLTAIGTRVAEAIVRSQTSGPERWDRVERAILADLVEHRTRHANEWGVTEVDGREITHDERVNAMERLEQWGYLHGIRADQADGPVRIDVKPKASQASGIDGLLADHHSGAIGGNRYSVSNTTHVGGNNNMVGAIQTGGRGNTATGTVTITNDQRAGLLKLIGDLSAQLEASDADAEALRHEVAELRAEVESPQASPEGIRSKILTAIGTASATQGVTFALHILAQMVGLVPA